MFDKILVPLDGSPLAEGILPQVRELAKIHGARVMFLRVAFALVFPGVDPTEAQVKTTQEAEGYAEKVCKAFQAEGIQAESHVRYGFPAEEILAQAARSGADLIAMATHGRTGPARWMLGSVSEQVIRNSNVPVLLIRTARHELQHPHSGRPTKHQEGGVPS